MSQNASSLFFAEPPPYAETFLLPDGGLNPIWFIWLYQLYGGLLSIEDVQVLEAFDSERDASGEIAANEATQLALVAGDAPNAAAVDALTKLIPTLQEDVSLRSALDNLEKLVWAASDAASLRAALNDLEKLVWTINDSARQPGLSLTYVTAKLTGGGANGSLTFVNGSLTAQTPAT